MQIFFEVKFNRAKYWSRMPLLSLERWAIDVEGGANEERQLRSSERRAPHSGAENESTGTRVWHNGRSQWKERLCRPPTRPAGTISPFGGDLSTNKQKRSQRGSGIRRKSGMEMANTEHTQKWMQRLISNPPDRRGPRWIVCLATPMKKGRRRQKKTIKIKKKIKKNK